MIASVFEAVQKLDEKDVPTSDRFCVVTPDVYYQLSNVDKLVSRDFSSKQWRLLKRTSCNDWWS